MKLKNLFWSPWMWVLGFTLVFVFGAFSSRPTAPVDTNRTLLAPEPPLPSATKAVKHKEVFKLSPPAERTVQINGPIGMGLGDVSDGVAEKILQLGTSNEPIYVVLNSPGGSVLEGAQIITAIEAAQGPVITVCHQMCASMAAMIFEYGTKRYIVDRSLLMFHPASGQAQGEVDKMASRLRTIQRFVGRMEAYVAKRAGITFEQYKVLSGVELWLDGEDAVAAGYADQLISLVLPLDRATASLTLPADTNSAGSAPPVFKISPWVTPFTEKWEVQ